MAEAEAAEGFASAAEAAASGAEAVAGAEAAEAAGAGILATAGEAALGVAGAAGAAAGGLAVAGAAAALVGTAWAIEGGLTAEPQQRRRRGHPDAERHAGVGRAAALRHAAEPALAARSHPHRHGQ